MTSTFLEDLQSHCVDHVIRSQGNEARGRAAGWQEAKEAIDALSNMELIELLAEVLSASTRQGREVFRFVESGAAK